MGEFLEIANSNVLFILISVVLLMVALQSVLFIRIALKRSDELGINKEIVKKVITNSAIFSIMPSLPIIIAMIAMMNALGVYLPWLRLSVMGSAMYESMAANIAITSLGYRGLGDLSISSSTFVTVMWVMTLGIFVGPIANILLLKKYDTSMKGLIAKGGGFMALVIPSLFTGFLAVVATPMMLNFGVPISMVVFFLSGLASIVFNLIGKKANIKIMSEFSFPLAMLTGLASAVVFSFIFQ